MSERVEFYVNYPGNAAQAAKFYEKVFGKEIQLMKFSDFPPGDGIEGIDLDKVGHAQIAFDNMNMMFSDDPFNKAVAGTNITLSWATDDKQRFQEVWDKFIAEGAQVDTEPEQTFWAELYGSVTDPFGIPWMLMYSSDNFQMPS